MIENNEEGMTQQPNWVDRCVDMRLAKKLGLFVFRTTLFLRMAGSPVPLSNVEEIGLLPKELVQREKLGWGTKEEEAVKHLAFFFVKRECLEWVMVVVVVKQ